MNTKYLLPAFSLLSVALFSSSASALDDPIAPTYQIDTEVKLLTDQRTRGISDSLMKPAAKVSVNFAHESGIVAIAEMVTVSKKQFTNGNGLDFTLGAGYRFGDPEAWHFGVGAAAELFPGASANAPHQVVADDGTVTGTPGTLIPTDNRDTSFNSRFAVFEFGYGALEGRLLDVVSDTYRGADTGTVCGSYLAAAIANNPLADPTLTAITDLNTPGSKSSECYARGDKNSKGSLLFDLNYKRNLNASTTLNLHYGYQKVNNFSELDFSDYSVGVSHKHWGFNWNLDWYYANVKTKEPFLTQDGAEMRETQKSAVVFSVSHKL